MKIGIDVSSLTYDRGVSRYTANLVRALAKQADTQLHLYGVSGRRYDELSRKIKALKIEAKTYHQAHPELANNTIITRIQKLPPSFLTWLWRFSINKISRFWPQLEIFHSWDWLQPPDKKFPLVSTIHDLAFFHFPETAHAKIVKAHRQSWKTLKDNKAHIIAVSQTTKKDIVKYLEIPPNHVHVIYEALPQETVATAEALSEAQLEIIKTELQLDKPYLLFVGTREPRKNLKRLIDVWQKNFSQTHQLIIAGDKGWDDSEKIAYPGLRFLGKVSNEQLAVLYSEADCFVYPSLYEGFGLPILEAFYFGTPVVTSNLASMPEVAGNAAELVDPTNELEIKRGIKKILTEDKQASQQRLQKMLIRLQLFTWERVARETLAVYQQAIEEFKQAPATKLQPSQSALPNLPNLPNPPSLQPTKLPEKFSYTFNDKFTSAKTSAQKFAADLKNVIKKKQQ